MNEPMLTQSIMSSRYSAKRSRHFSLLYKVIVILTIAYLFSIIIRSSLSASILALPVLYIIPGLLLIFITSRRQEYSLVRLIVISFFLSTILSVIITSILLVLHLSVASSIGLIYVIFIFGLTIFAVLRCKSPQVKGCKTDYILFCVAMVAYALLVSFFIFAPRTFSMDETTYIAWSRYALLNGETYPIGSTSGNMGLLYLLDGRFFWTLLITPFLGFTGLLSYQANAIGALFLPMIAVASTLLLPVALKNSRFLKVAIFSMVLANPLLLLFSDFALNDLAVTFYLLLMVIFFIESFGSAKNSISLDFDNILLTLSTLIVTFLIKDNIVLLLSMYVILLVYLLRNKLYKISKTYKVFLGVLVLPLIAYEAMVDIPYVLSVWFFKNETVATLTHSLLVISPGEWFLGIFLQTPWKPLSALSYDFIGLLRYLYYLLTPETSSLLVASVGLVLPLLLKLNVFSKNIQLKILVYISTVTLWVSYLLYLSSINFSDVPRYFLFMVPIITAIALIAFYEIFSSRTGVSCVLFILPMIFLMWVQSTLTIEKGGVSLSYGLPAINWTGSLLLIQLMIFAAIISIGLTSNRTYHVKLTKWSLFVTTKKALMVTLLLVLTISAIFFSVYSFQNSTYMKADESTRMISNYSYPDNAFVISNFYPYMRPYVPDSLLSSGFLLSTPANSSEFYDALKMVPNGTLLFISSNPQMAWYDYANSYIEQLAKYDTIPISPKTNKITYNGLLLDLSLSSTINSVPYNQVNSTYVSAIHGGRVVDGLLGKAVEFDGKTEYAQVYNFTFPRTDYSVETRFKLTSDPSSFGVMSDGSPVMKILLAKRYQGYNELIVSITSDGAIQAQAKNENNTIRFTCTSPGGLIKANNWCDLVLSVTDKEVNFYLNGLLVSKSSVDGLNQNLFDYPEAFNETLKIGSDGTSSFTQCRYFEGAIEDVLIYNRSLSTEEISNMYNCAKLVNQTKTLKVYEIDNSIQLRKTNEENFTLSSVKIDRTNSTNVRVMVNASAVDQRMLIINIGTMRFLKVLTANSSIGNNTYLWNFKYSFADRSGFGSYIADISQFIVYDEQGNLLYSKLVAPFTLANVSLTLWILCLLLLFSFILLLCRRYLAS